MHVLVIPKRHIAPLNELAAEDDGLVGEMVRRGAPIAQERGYGEGGASSRALWQVLVLVVAADDGLLRERQDERSRMVMSTFTSLADRAGRALQKRGRTCILLTVA